MGWILVIIFAIGVVGCVITIPIAAYKFFSVLFEKDVQGSTLEIETLTQA